MRRILDPILLVGILLIAIGMLAVQAWYTSPSSRLYAPLFFIGHFLPWIGALVTMIGMGRIVVRPLLAGDSRGALQAYILSWSLLLIPILIAMVLAQDEAEAGTPLSMLFAVCFLFMLGTHVLGVVGLAIGWSLKWWARSNHSPYPSPDSDAQ
jgi:hypothetical protein